MGMTVKIRPRHLPRVMPDGRTVVPSRFVATEEGAGRSIELDVEVNQWGQPRCRRLSVSDDDPVTGETLREIPVARLLQKATLQAASFMVHEETKDGIATFVGPPSGSERREIAEKYGDVRRPRSGTRITDETLRSVAALYRQLIEDGIRGPTSRLAAELDVSRSTAARWVRLARDRGYLGKAKPGARGELPSA